MARQALLLILIVLVFGIFVPWYKGFAFLDARMIAAYGCLALLFAAPASADFAAANRSSAARVMLARLALIVGYSWGVGVVILATGLATLNLAYWRGAMVAPPGSFCAAILLCSLTAAAAVAASSALLARRFSAGGAKAVLRFGFLLALLALVLNSRLPERWQIFLSEHSTRRAISRLAWEGSAVFALLAALAVIPLLRLTRNPTDAP